MIAQILDTETTDLINNMAVDIRQQPEIISLYYSLVNLDSGLVLKSESFLFKPSKPIPENITKINGITNEMVANASTFQNIHLIIKEDMEFAADVSIAHNLAYDCDMINIEMKRCGVVVNWPRKICSVEQTMHFCGYRLSLTNLYKYLFGEEFQDKHSAAGDVAALTRCCVELRRLKCL